MAVLALIALIALIAFSWIAVATVFYTGEDFIVDIVFYAFLFAFLIQLLLFWEFRKNIWHLLLILFGGFAVYGILYAVLNLTDNPDQPWWFTGIPSVLNLT